MSTMPGYLIEALTQEIEELKKINYSPMILDCVLEFLEYLELEMPGIQDSYLDNMVFENYDGDLGSAQS